MIYHQSNFISNEWIETGNNGVTSISRKKVFSEFTYHDRFRRILSSSKIRTRLPNLHLHVKTPVGICQRHAPAAHSNLGFIIPVHRFHLFQRLLPPSENQHDVQFIIFHHETNTSTGFKAGRRDRNRLVAQSLLAPAIPRGSPLSGYRLEAIQAKKRRLLRNSLFSNGPTFAVILHLKR